MIKDYDEFKFIFYSYSTFIISKRYRKISIPLTFLNVFSANGLVKIKNIRNLVIDGITCRNFAYNSKEIV